MIFDFIRKSLSCLLELDEVHISPDSRLYDDLGMDELDIVDMIMDIEDEYDVEIDDEALENFRTVNDVVTYLEEHM